MNSTKTQDELYYLSKTYQDALNACLDLVVKEEASNSPLGRATLIVGELASGLLSIFNALSIRECLHDDCAAAALGELHTQFMAICKKHSDELYKVKKP
jgi:hypothetical protein